MAGWDTEIWDGYRTLTIGNKHLNSSDDSSQLKQPFDTTSKAISPPF